MLKQCPASIEGDADSVIKMGICDWLSHAALRNDSVPLADFTRNRMQNATMQVWQLKTTQSLRGRGCQLAEAWWLTGEDDSSPPHRKFPSVCIPVSPSHPVHPSHHSVSSPT